MNTLRILGILAIALMLGGASCEGDQSLVGAPPDPTPPDGETPIVLNSLELLTSSPQMQSDGSTVVTLSTFAKNANNQVVAGVPVVFSATSGTLFIVEATTNAQGIATAELNTTGNPTNRSITVTATAGTLTDTVDIAVVGSTMQIQGPISLVLGDTSTYTITLADSAGTGIANQPIEIASANGNGLSATTLTTGPNGIVSVTLDADVAGNDTLTADALPDADGNPTVTASFDIGVSSDNFRFTAPDSNDEISLFPTMETVTVRWLDDSDAPVTGETITFASTRGDLAATTAITDINGDATVQISSTTAGPATITATTPAPDSTTAQLAVEFVATIPDQLTMQVKPGVIAPNEISTITARVIDPDDNRVKGATVTFTLTDTTGGSLSVASAVTNSAGEAQTVYTASSATSPDDGVTITGRVVGTALQTDAKLTVAGQALSMVFGTGNSIIENAEDTTYTKNYTLIVRDSSGAGVPNTTASLSVLSTGYYKGVLVAGTTFFFRPADAPFCDSEDQDGDGVLDPVPVSEDVNFDMELTPGGVAIVTPGIVTTDETGVANFQIIYPQDHAMWVTADITAITTVAGTESRRTAGFEFPASADDLSINSAPPNPVSPWGPADPDDDPVTIDPFEPAPATCTNTH